MKTLALLTSLLFFPLPSSATVHTGNSFLRTLDGADQATKNILNGYVAGLYDANERQLGVCIGENVNMSQLRDATALYFQNNPADRGYSVADFFVRAIKKEWDCD